MRVKRFTADDMPQAMRLVREALGADAVILSSCRLPTGQVELSAATDELPAPEEAMEAAPKALSALARRVEGLNRKIERHLVISEAVAGFSARPEVAPVYHHLTGQEIDPVLIAQLLDGLMSPDGLGVLPRLSIRIKKLLKVGGSPRLSRGGPAVWALVGPTGVGKTTTVAKLAATFSLKHRLKVGLVTVDTFRMAAAEQLSVYGRIMEVPTLLAATAEDLAGAMRRFADMDLVLVDTVGRSAKDDENLEELNMALGTAQGISCHLVLASPTRDSDQAQVVEGFSRFKPRSLIFTKLDETQTFGPILNRVVQTGLPVSYLTFGQKVPDDLEEASLDGLTRRLMPAKRDLRLP